MTIPDLNPCLLYQLLIVRSLCTACWHVKGVVSHQARNIAGPSITCPFASLPCHAYYINSFCMHVRNWPGMMMFGSVLLFSASSKCRPSCDRTCNWFGTVTVWLSSCLCHTCDHCCEEVSVCADHA